MEGRGPRTRRIDCDGRMITTRSESPYVVCYKSMKTQNVAGILERAMRCRCR
jgi:hypothetical protein